jgi:uncharacterized membrane protein YfcA
LPPLLTTFFGLRQLEARGLVLAFVSPSALIALLAYAEAGEADWLVGLPLALGGIAAISPGVAYASRLPDRRMRLAFCGLVLLTAALLALRGAPALDRKSFIHTLAEGRGDISWAMLPPPAGV